MQGNFGRQTREQAVSRVHRGRDVDPARSGLLPETLQGLNDAPAPSHLPLKTITRRNPLETLDQSGAAHRHGIADLEAGKSGHQLPRPALPDTEDPLDRQAVQILRLQTTKVG